MDARDRIRRFLAVSSLAARVYAGYKAITIRERRFGLPPEEAEGKLLELYDMAEQFFGTVPNNVKMFGVSPAMLENQVQFAVYSMNHPTLSAPFFAMIRLLVSHAAGSPYCAHMNAGLLMQQSSDDKVLLRYFGGSLSDCVRITVGTPVENDRLLETLAKMEI